MFLIVIIYYQLTPTTEQQINKGNLEQKVGNYAQAENIWQQVLNNDPNNVVALSNLGIALSEQKRVDEGSEKFDKVIKLKPDSADAYYSEV